MKYNELPSKRMTYPRCPRCGQGWQTLPNRYGYAKYGGYDRTVKACNGCIMVHRTLRRVPPAVDEEQEIHHDFLVNSEVRIDYTRHKMVER